MLRLARAAPFASLLLGMVWAGGAARASEGMWTFDHLPMSMLRKQYGFTPDAAWIDRVTHASARLAEGCSASFVSADGLVMTNHHCANACLQALSTPGHNYFADAFTSDGVAGEPKCPAMELDRLDRITDVTTDVQAATKGLSDRAYSAAMRSVEAKLTSACVGGDAAHWRCDLVSLFHGGRSAIYRYRRYDDVHLVMAPEQNAAFFGGDPDNFNFPRFDLDMAFLRVFDGGKPVHTAFFHVDPAGPRLGQMVITAGNPGSTQRGLPASALEFERDVQLPAVTAFMSAIDGILWQFSQESARHAAQAQALLFGMQNALKSEAGTMLALQDPRVIAARQAQDSALARWIAASADRRATYGAPFADVARIAAAERVMFRRYFALNVIGLEAAPMRDAITLVEAAAQRAKPDGERRSGFHDAEFPALEAEIGASEPMPADLAAVMLAYDMINARRALGADDPVVRALIGADTPEHRAVELMRDTKLGDPRVRLALLRGGLPAIASSTDPLIVLARAIAPAREAQIRQWDDSVRSPLHRAEGAIARARFAQAMDTHQEETLYPDATFSPRLSFGRVEGWEQDGRMVPAFTTFGGLYDHATGADPFKLDPLWIAGKSKLDLATHFDFVSSNDIAGGNSGSPMLDAKGDVVGLVFDSNLPGIAGDVFYDGSTNRTVSVDTSAIVAALRTLYGDRSLSDELVSGHL